jgi:hypothetical protein
LLESFGVFHPRRGVGVLSLEIGDYLGVLFLAEPEVVVGADVAVKGVGSDDGLGAWRSGFLSRNEGWRARNCYYRYGRYGREGFGEKAEMAHKSL